MKNKKRKEKDIENEVEVKTTLTAVTRLMLLSGGIVFAVSYTISAEEAVNPILAAIKDAAQNIALTLISAGLISALVEMSTITTVVKNALQKLVSGDFLFDKFSEERLTELNRQLAVQRSGKCDLKADQLDKTIYFLEPKLLEDSVGIYYEYHRTTTIIQPDEENKMFNKWVSAEYRLNNRFKEPHSIKLCISLVNNSENLSDEDIRKLFKIEKFEIYCAPEEESDDKNLENKLIENDLESLVQIEAIEKKPHTTYNYMIKIEYPIENIATCLVKLQYSYNIPMSDPLQSFKLNHPCKEFEHTITIRDSNWEIMADAYTAFFFTDENRDYQVSQNVPSSVSIVFKDWALTGAGYMALLFRNKQHI